MSMQIDKLPAFDSAGYVHVIVETVKGSTNKYKYSQSTEIFEHVRSLAKGLIFPFDFGFVPSTKADDDDPLDVILLSDNPTFCGCLVHAKLLGILEANQTKNGKTYRNDRVLALQHNSIDFAKLNSWNELPATFIADIESFFKQENESRGEKFLKLGWKDAQAANQAIIASAF